MKYFNEKPVNQIGKYLSK